MAYKIVWSLQARDDLWEIVTFIAAFEARLADATQDAVDAVIHTAATVEKSRLEKLRLDEFHLAQEVLRASNRWLTLASNPRRRGAPLAQVLRLIELATKLGRLAAGLPTGDEKPRSRVEPPGYWTQPSVEEALQKIYGSDPPATFEHPAPTSVVPAPPTKTPPASPPWPPSDDKHDLAPHALAIGPHGFSCVQPGQSKKDSW
jgi:hypothetical protein